MARPHTSPGPSAGLALEADHGLLAPALGQEVPLAEVLLEGRWVLLLKGIGSPHEYFFLSSIKLNQYFPHMRHWFLNFFGSLLKKILNKKILLASIRTLTNIETCNESRHRILILARLTITVIGWFSPLDHLSLDRGKKSA